VFEINEIKKQRTMKRIITLTLAALCFAAAAFAQEKKTVAVYVTGNCSEDIKKVVSSRIIAQIVRSRDYAAVERTPEFDQALRREQNYQYSGNVDDGQVIKLGKQFGADLVCVADASQQKWFKSEYLFTTRLINIETGLVISFSMEYKEYTTNYSISNGEEISITDRITTQLLQSVISTEGRQKLAVYVTSSSDVFKAKTVSSRLTQNFTNSGAYAVVDRTSDFRMELNRQQSGRVDDSQISRLGRQFGVNQVCVVDVISSSYTTVRIINVETGIIVATAEAKSWNIEAADGITHELMKQLVGGCTEKDRQIMGNYAGCCEGLVNVSGICRDLAEIYWLPANTCPSKYLARLMDAVAWDTPAKCPSGYRIANYDEVLCLYRSNVAGYITGETELWTQTEKETRNDLCTKDYWYDARNFYRASDNSHKHYYVKIYKKKKNYKYYTGKPDVKLRYLCVRE
jgi:hypothetical protein